MIGQRRRWQVSMADAAAEALVCAALRGLGDVALHWGEQGSTVEAGQRLMGVVVEVTSSTADTGLDVVRQLRRRYPALTIVVVHGRDDTAAAWAAMRSGATPWAPPSLRGSHVWSEASAADLADALHVATTDEPPMGMDLVRHQVDDALVCASSGRPMLAISRLCRLHRSESTAVALDVLGQTRLALMVRLRRRSRHRIPLERVMDRLDVDSAADRWRCMTLLQRSMHQTALEADLTRHATPEAPTSEQLYVAFHATAALADFSAARSWTPPERLLSHLRDHVAQLEACASA